MIYFVDYEIKFNIKKISSIEIEATVNVPGLFFLNGRLKDGSFSAGGNIKKYTICVGSKLEI